MAPSMVQFPSYLTFAIITLMAVIVTFPTSVAIPGDRQDQATVFNGHGMLEGQPKTSNVTNRACAVLPFCTTIMDTCGSTCTCNGNPGSCVENSEAPPPQDPAPQDPAPQNPPPQTPSTCTSPGNICLLGIGCYPGCTCSDSLQGNCQ